MCRIRTQSFTALLAFSVATLVTSGSPAYTIDIPLEEFLADAKVIVHGRLVSLHMKAEGAQAVETGTLEVEQVLLGGSGVPKIIEVHASYEIGHAEAVTLAGYFGKKIVWIFDGEPSNRATVSTWQQMVELWTSPDFQSRCAKVQAAVCTGTVQERYQKLCATLSTAKSN